MTTAVVPTARPGLGAVLSRRASVVPALAAVAILLVLMTGAQIYFGNFVTPRVLSALLLDNAYLLILAVGMTFVILTGGIDLSVGSVLALTGILGARMMAADVSPALVVPVMLLTGATIGLLIGVLVQFFDVQPFIASLAGLFLARGLSEVGRGDFELVHEEAEMTLFWAPYGELYAAALDGRVADGPVVQALLLARALDLLPTPRDAR